MEIGWPETVKPSKGKEEEKKRINLTGGLAGLHCFPTNNLYSTVHQLLI
jgi:hypothetical protein